MISPPTNSNAFFLSAHRLPLLERREDRPQRYPLLLPARARPGLPWIDIVKPPRFDACPMCCLAMKSPACMSVTAKARTIASSSWPISPSPCCVASGPGTIPSLLFPGRPGPDRTPTPGYMDRGTTQNAFARVVHDCGIRKRVSIHSLRTATPPTSSRWV